MGTKKELERGQKDEQRSEWTDRLQTDVTNREKDRHLLTNWVSVKEQHRGSQDSSKHSVVQYSGGIHTDKVEGDGACKVNEDGCGSGASVDTNPLISGEVASGAPCHILKTGAISCGTVCPVERKRL